MKKAFPYFFLFYLLAFTFCTKNSGQKDGHSLKDSAVFAVNSDSIDFYRRKDINRAKAFINKVEEYSDSTGVPVFIPKFFLHKAMYFNSIGELDTAFKYYQTAIEISKKRKNKKIEALCYLNLGNLYLSKGDYVNAIESDLKSMKLFEMLNYQIGLGAVNGNLGLVYENMKDYTKALEYQNNSLEIRKKLHDSIGIAQTLGNIGNIFYDKGDKKTCMDYQFKSLNMHTSLNNKIGMAITISNIGQLYNEMNEVDSAIKYSNLGLKIREEIRDRAGLPYSYITLGIIYNKKGNVAEAENLFLKAKEILQKNSDFSELKNVEYNLYELYTAQDKHKEALDAYKHYITARDTVYNVEQIREVNKKSMQFEYDKKEALAHEEVEKQKLFRNGAIVGGIFLLIFLFVVFRNFKNKKKANEVLTHQKHIIEEKQKEIVESIQYAEQIQKTLIANHDFVNQTIPDSFVVFKPKDIVSGDFYWATSVGSWELGVRSGNRKSNDDFQTPNSELTANSELFFLAVCDSTGHGVPGAFMSLLNISFLNEAINEKHILEPGSIFDHVRKRLVESISADGRKDGMDGLLVCFDKSSGLITYAASNNAPVLVSGNTLTELPADKMPVGKGEKSDAFRTFTIPAKKGDMLYLFTDGYPDQFGGPKGKKFKYKQLEELLLSLAPSEVQEQSKIIDKRFEEWKGELEQIDDVCVVGIRI